MSGVDLASMLISMYRTLEDVHYDSIGHWPGYGEKKINVDIVKQELFGCIVKNVISACV